MSWEQCVELKEVLAQGNVSFSGEFSSYPNPELLVPGAKLYRSDFLSALRAMLQYFHQNISTWIQMNQELARCPGDILGMSVRVGYHIKVSKMPWSRAPLPH